MFNLRNILIKRGDSLSKTLAMTIIKSASISTAAFTEARTYSKQSEARRAALDATFDYTKGCGADKGGAVKAEIRGGFHTSSGIDSFVHLTVRLFNKEGEQMYFFRKSDSSYWDVIHIPENSKANSALWRVPDDYKVITKAEFLARKLNA